MTACTRGLFRIPDLARRVDAFDRPVRHGVLGDRMQHERNVAGKRQSPKSSRGIARLLHVAEQVQLDGRVNRCRASDRTARASSPKLPRESPGWTLSTAARSAPASCVGCVSTCSCEPSAITCTLIRRAARRQHGQRFALGIGQPRARAHAERIVEHQQHRACSLAMLAAGAIDERIGERQRQQHEQSNAAATAAADSAAGDA